MHTVRRTIARVQNGFGSRPLLLAGLMAVVVVSGILAAHSMTLNSITIDGDMSDWENVLADPQNVVFDSSGSSDPDPTGQSDRDIVRVATTWDDTNLYFYVRRSAAPQMSTNFLFYIDTDDDGYLTETDYVLNYPIDQNGLKNTRSGHYYEYAKDNTASEPETVTGDGVSEPGSFGDEIIAITNSLDAQSGPVGTFDAISIEMKVSWESLNLDPGTPIRFHTACSNGTNIPKSVEDNVGWISTTYTTADLTPDREGSAAPSQVVTYTHTLSHVGNRPDTFDLSAVTASGWTARITDASGITTSSVTLGSNESTTVYLEVTVPAGASLGSVGTSILQAQSQFNDSVVVSVTDDTYVGLLSVYPNNARTVSASETISYQHYIANNTTSTLTLDLEGYSWSKWDTEVYDAAGSSIISTISVPAGEERLVTLKVSVPSTASIGFVDISELRATAQENSAYSDYARDVSTVWKAIDVRPDHDTSTTESSIANYWHTITNSTGSSATVSLSTASSLGWTTRIFDSAATSQITSVTLASGESTETLIRVTVPAGTAISTVNTTTLTAALSGSPGVNGTATDITRIVSLATFSDPGFRSPSSLFRLGDRTYAQAGGVTGTEVWFRWYDSDGTSKKTAASNVISAQSESIYDLLGTDRVGTWTVGYAQTSTGATVTSVPFVVTYDAEILTLSATDAESAGDTVTVDSTVRNNGVQTISNSAIDYTIWFDSDGDALFGAGDRYIDSSGQPQVYSSGTVYTHRSTITTLTSGSSYSEPGAGWTISNSDFIDWGIYQVSEVWTTSGGILIDEATTTFYSPGEGPDLSLDKELAAGSPTWTPAGSTASFTIALHNSGDTTLTTIPLDDEYNSSYLQYSAATPAPSTVTSGTLYWSNLGPLAPDDTTTITVNFTVVGEPVDGIATNSAEVTAAVDSGGLSPRSVSDEATVGVDFFPPVTTDNAPVGPQSEASVLVTLTASDARSGVYATYYNADGAGTSTYSTPVSFSTEGTHTLEYWSVDNAGNIESTRTVLVVIDTTPPDVTITGVTPGESYNATVTPIVTITGATEETVTLNGAPYVSGTPISLEGTYILNAIASGASGATTSKTVTFTIDLTAPDVTITPAPAAPNGENGWYVTSPVPASVSSGEGSAMLFYSLIGASGPWNVYAAPVPLANEGDNMIWAYAADTLGNASDTASLTVSIDTVDPATTDDAPAGWSDTAFNVTITPTDSTSGPAYTYYAWDGGSVTTYTAPVAVLEGSHTLAYYSVDVAGNVEATRTVTVLLDTTAPDVTITTPADGLVTSATVTPAATSTDDSATLSATLNGSPFTLGSSVSTEGVYTLVVTATDPAGNTATDTVGFEIDTTPPSIDVDDVVDGESYNTTVTPTITITGEDTSTITLNGFPYTSGTPITEEGTHTIVVTATDEAGNTTTESITFYITDSDTIAPDITIHGVTDGETYPNSATPTASSTDPDATVTATLNGQPFVLGTTITTPGTYTLVTMATDPSGNSASDTVTFTVTDTIAPPTPLNLTATALDVSIQVDWNPVAVSDLAEYNVYRALSASGPFTLIGSTPAGTTTYEDTDVGSGIVYYYRVTAVDTSDNESSSSNVASASIDPSVQRLWGPDRLGTAVDISTETFDSANVVIIATSRTFADALAASGLAGTHQAPLLLTNPTSLAVATQNEIKRLGAERAIIVGGTGAVGPEVATTLSRMGLQVDRYGGATRYHTSVLIAEEIEKHEILLGRPFTKQTFLARGDNFPDALSVSPLAYTLRAPILLTLPKVLPTPTLTYVQAEDFDHQLVAGGTGAVSDAVANKLAQAGEMSSVRKGGIDRYKTSTIVAEYGVGQGWAEWKAIGIATGRNFPDALTGGVAMGEMGGILMVTPPLDLHPDVRAHFVNHKHEIFEVRLFGGTAALSENVANQVKTLMK